MMERERENEEEKEGGRDREKVAGSQSTVATSGNVSSKARSLFLHSIGRHTYISLYK